MTPHSSTLSWRIPWKEEPAGLQSMGSQKVRYDQVTNTTQMSLDHFFKRVAGNESSTQPKPVPSVSGMSETAACPPSPLADEPSALNRLPPPLPLPTSSHLFPWCRSAPVSSCCSVLFKALCCKVKSIFVCLFFMYCLKSIIDLLQYSTA